MDDIFKKISGPLQENRSALIRAINREFYRDKAGLLKAAVGHLRQLESTGGVDELVFFINILLVVYPRNEELIKIAERHLPAFYGDELESQLRLNQGSAVRYLTEIMRVTPVKSIIDFGTGPGAWLKAARDCGIDRIVGVEKHYRPAIDFPAEIISVDVCDPIERKSDLAVCVEVAEHIHPDKSELLIENIVRCSDLVLFGAASEHQSGDGHINCRKQSFWAELFMRKGYRLIDFFRAKFWTDPDIVKNYVQNTFLYVQTSSQHAASFSGRPLLDVDHPEMINAHYLNDYRKNKIFFENFN